MWLSKLEQGGFRVILDSYDVEIHPVPEFKTRPRKDPYVSPLTGQTVRDPVHPESL